MPYKVLCILRTCCVPAIVYRTRTSEPTRQRTRQDEDDNKPQNAPFEARWVVKTFDSIRPIDCINIKNALIRLSQALNAPKDFLSDSVSNPR